MLRKNSGRSETLNPRPERHYLLKGLVRCAYCGMPMWAQTYNNGQRYYREHKNSRSYGSCPEKGNSIPCHTADEQAISLVQNIELGERWLEEVLTIISVKDEADRINKRINEIQQRLRRLGVAASREKSSARIINEPFEGSPLFQGETGEARTPPEIIFTL